MCRTYGAPRESIQMIASRSGRHRSSTGTVPDHWAVQATATTEPAGMPARAISRDDVAVIRSHHCPGSCSAPPPGSSLTWQVSCSAAATSPAVDTRATLSAEVPRSIARMWRVMGLQLEEQVEVTGQQLMDDVGGQAAGHAVDRRHPRADAGIGPDFRYRLGQVGQEAVGDPGPGVAERDRDVNRGRQLQAVLAPAPVAHVLHDLVDVEAVTGGERGDPQRVAEHPEPGYGRDPVPDPRSRLQDPAGRLGIAVLADRDHRRPAGGGQGAGPAAGERG